MFYSFPYVEMRVCFPMKITIFCPLKNSNETLRLCNYNNSDKTIKFKLESRSIEFFSFGVTKVRTSKEMAGLTLPNNVWVSC
jgi:hypothetical protein